MTDPGVSVVVPVLNGEATLLDQLRALQTQESERNFEIIIADNGSSDGTVALVQKVSESDARVRLVDASLRRGVNYARSVGAREALGEYILYCDADDLVDAKWVSEMARALDDADLVGGYIDEHLLNDFIDPEHRTPRMKELPTIDIMPLPFAAGGCFGIKRSVLIAVSGWNEAHPAGVGGDDIDLNWRCQLEGFHLEFAQTAILHFRYRSDLRGAIAQSFGYGRGAPYLLKKFRRCGAHRRSLQAAARDWSSLALGLGRAVRDEQYRRRWLTSVAFATGRVVGNVQFRTFCP